MDRRHSRPAETRAPVIDRQLAARLRRRLLAWFDRCRRDLPWRHTRDPYPIWVSEVMLQQTQAATVVRFFERFLDAFPTLAALAAADEQDVLRQWQGLGYYRRARDLHRGARHLAAHHGARIPDDPELLAGVPGVGRYTLGAVLSQAFDRRLPILEANSRRVLCRLFGLRESPDRGHVMRRLWEIAEALLPRRRVGDFNQSLMELGALICTSVPDCPACPVADDCVAHRLGLQAQIPARPARKEPVHVHEVAVVVHRGRQVLLVQRPEGGRWAGLWEFPRGPVAAAETHEEAAARLVPGLTGVRTRLGPKLATLRHSVTHHRIALVCFEATYRGGTFRPGSYRQGRWAEREALAVFPVSAPQRRLIKALAGSKVVNCPAS
ncbi:MAG TPA: A/G-specific adenine glycosylase [Gemmataceae bacterium]|nr:A/G-specific adenine glycosylase [Gemmataceae bacterium]